MFSCILSHNFFYPPLKAPEKASQLAASLGQRKRSPGTYRPPRARSRSERHLGSNKLKSREK